MTGRWWQRGALLAAALALLAAGIDASASAALPGAHGTTSVLSGSVRGTATPAAAAGFHLVAVGDIAREGGGQARTAALIAGLDPTALLLLGDLAYDDGSPSDFASWFTPAYGRFAAISWPVPGNHDYNTADAAGYRSQFGVTGPTWWARRAGAWLVIGLDSERVSSSAQRAFVVAALRANQGRPTVVAWHRPRYSSGMHRDQADVAPLWRLVARDRDVQLVLWGHDHDYERMYVPVRDRRAKAAFVVGTGGAELRGVRPYAGRRWSRQLISHAYGVLDLRLRPTSFSWRYLRANGVVRDIGSRSVVRR
jgi:3',5'-cyclic AMP phosphodiesterase CpdA